VSAVEWLEAMTGLVAAAALVAVAWAWWWAFRASSMARCAAADAAKARALFELARQDLVVARLWYDRAIEAGR
jgi:hypothetical protein